MYIECQYNGRDLYSNHWDICTVEEGDEEQVIVCPVAPGKKRMIKNRPIPSYLPKVGDSNTLAPHRVQCLIMK